MAKKVKSKKIKSVKKKPASKKVIRNKKSKSTGKSMEVELKKFVSENKSCIIAKNSLMLLGADKNNLKDEQIKHGSVTLHNNKDGTYFIHY